MKNVEKDKTKIKKEIIANNGIIYKIKKNIKKISSFKIVFKKLYTISKRKVKENNNKEIIKYLNRKKPPKI